MEVAREKLAKEKGASALEPWNLSHALSGDVEKCALTRCHQPISFLDCVSRGCAVVFWGNASSRRLCLPLFTLAFLVHVKALTPAAVCDVLNRVTIDCRQADGSLLPF